MRQIKLIFILILLFLTNLNAQISLKTGLSKSTIHIGDYTVYYIEITYDNYFKLMLPAPGKELGSFDIKDYNIIDTQKKDKGTSIKRIEYTITTYFLGEFEIPTIEIQYKDQDNNIGHLKTEPLLVKVVPIKKLPSDKNDIRDIKQPFYVKTHLWLYIIIIIILIGLGYLGYYIYNRKFKKDKTDEPEIKEISQLPEDIEALNAIKELQRTDYLKNQQYKLFYIKLSEIIRTYLHRRYSISTLEETSFEILRDLKKILNDKNLLLIFEHFFQDSDMVKFAKHKPTQNQIKGIVQTAIQLIQKTKRRFSDEIL